MRIFFVLFFTVIVCLSYLTGQTHPIKKDLIKKLDKITSAIQSGENERTFLFKPDTLIVFGNASSSEPEPDMLLVYAIYHYQNNQVKTIDVLFPDDPEDNYTYTYYYDDQGRVIRRMTDDGEDERYGYTGDLMTYYCYFLDNECFEGDSIRIYQEDGLDCVDKYYIDLGQLIPDVSIQGISANAPYSYNYKVFDEGQLSENYYYANESYLDTKENYVFPKLKMYDGPDSTSLYNDYIFSTYVEFLKNSPIEYIEYDENLLTGQRILTSKLHAHYDLNSIISSYYKFDGDDSTLVEESIFNMDDQNRIIYYESSYDSNVISFSFHYNEYGYVDTSFVEQSGEFQRRIFDYEVDSKNRLTELKTTLNINNSFYDSNLFKFGYKASSATNAIEKTPLNLSPNPTSHTLALQMPQSGLPAQYSIIDVRGHICQQGQMFANTMQQSVNVEQLSSGIYHFRLIQGDKVHVEKFIKIN